MVLAVFTVTIPTVCSVTQLVLANYFHQLSLSDTVLKTVVLWSINEMKTTHSVCIICNILFSY